MNDKKVNTLERGVKTYLPPLYHRYFRGYVAWNETSESSTMADIVKKFFDEMPQQEKERLLKISGSKNSY